MENGQGLLCSRMLEVMSPCGIECIVLDYVSKKEDCCDGEKKSNRGKLWVSLDPTPLTLTLL